MKDETLTAQDVFIEAKYYIVDKKQGLINCFITEKNCGWEGYKIAIRYEEGKGHYWQVAGFWAAISNVKLMVNENPDGFTKDKFKAASILGVCPKCTGLLFDEFINALHNVEICGNRKRAVAMRSEFA